MLALFITIFATSGCMGPTYVQNSHSMEPTLYDGDYLFTRRINPTNLQRGDVIVFYNPQRPQEMQAKRLVGLPGETIEIKDTQLYVNDVALEEVYKHKEFLPEELFGPLLLGEEEYFVLGDNRPASQDSRYFGPVPNDMILGKVLFLSE